MAMMIEDLAHIALAVDVLPFRHGLNPADLAEDGKFRGIDILKEDRALQVLFYDFLIHTLFRRLDSHAPGRIRPEIPAE